MMCELIFTIEAAEPLPFAASPTLAFKLRAASANPTQQVQNVLLQCQIQIDALLMFCATLGLVSTHRLLNLQS